MSIVYINYKLPGALRMKHILCAFRNLQSDMLEGIHDYAGKHDW